MRKIGFTQPVETQAEPMQKVKEQPETVKRKKPKEKSAAEENAPC